MKDRRSENACQVHVYTQETLVCYHVHHDLHDAHKHTHTHANKYTDSHTHM